MSDLSASGPHHRHHRPALPGGLHFEHLESGSDPAVLAEAADRAAQALVRGARAIADQALVERVVHLAETEGLDSIAELWARAPSDSLAGAVWRLYLLRSWVYADPSGAAREFDAGRRSAPVAEAISGVEEPPGPDEVRRMVDEVLSGVVTGDFADTLFRAAAFAKVAATGRAHREVSHDIDVSASRLFTLADQLESAGHLELEGHLG